MLRAARPSPAGALRELLGNRSFILLVLYFTLPALAGWVVRDWMPAILKEEFDIGQGQAGVAATLYWQVAAIVGAVAGGWLADRWMRQTDARPHLRQRHRHAPDRPGDVRRRQCAATGLLWVAVAFLVLFGLGWGFFDCNNMPILCQIVRPELRATGYGIMNLVSISCGGFADWGFGMPARSAGAAERHLRRFRQRRGHLDRARAAHPATVRRACARRVRQMVVRSNRLTGGCCLHFLVARGAPPHALPALASLL